MRRTQYYTREARKSAVNNIGRLMAKVSTIKGDQLEYTDATAIIRYLADYMELIAKDERDASKEV